VRSGEGGSDDVRCGLFDLILGKCLKEGYGFVLLTFIASDCYCFAAVAGGGWAFSFRGRFRTAHGINRS